MAKILNHEHYLILECESEYKTGIGYGCGILVMIK
jgi:hypothetical protein